jgi:hypothetical protein
MAPLELTDNFTYQSIDRGAENRIPKGSGVKNEAPPPFPSYGDGASFS